MAHTTPLSIHSAVLSNDVQKLSELIEQEESLNIKDNLGNTPLHTAAQEQNGECLNILLNHPGCEVNLCNAEGCTSLFLACDNKSPSIGLITDLLNKSADPNICNYIYVSPLHIACKNGNAELVNLLLNYGADINVQDIDDYTALHVAVENNKKIIVEYLLLNRADADLTDVSGFNPLMFAIVLKNEYIFRLLLRYTKDLNVMNNTNHTALMLAIQTGNFAMVKLLVNDGAKVHSLDIKTPLILQDLYDKDKLQIFKYIWSQVNHENLSYNIYFIFVLTNSLKLNEHLEHLKIIFESEKLDLAYSFGKINNIYDMILKSIREDDRTFDYFNNNKENLIFVFKGLVKHKATVSFIDFINILLFLKCCPYRLEIINCILQNINFIITSSILLEAFCSHPQLGFCVLQNIFHGCQPSTIFLEFIYFSQINCMKYLFQFFTPCKSILQRILHIATISEKQELLKFPRVKSLKEISRDVVRTNIGKNIPRNYKCRIEFQTNIQKLNIPNVIKNILLYKMPVNLIPKED